MQNHMGANPSSDRDRALAHINHPLLINVSPLSISNLLRINTQIDGPPSNFDFWVDALYKVEITPQIAYNCGSLD